ncbi:MAG: acyl carrier protein [Myxococcota bacterium]
MTRDSVRQVLRDHIREAILLMDEPLDDDEDLFEAGFDSMAVTRLLVFVEETYGVAIGDEEIVSEDVATVNTVAALVCARAESA